MVFRSQLFSWRWDCQFGSTADSLICCKMWWHSPHPSKQETTIFRATVVKRHYKFDIFFFHLAFSGADLLDVYLISEWSVQTQRAHYPLLESLSSEFWHFYDVSNIFLSHFLTMLISHTDKCFLTTYYWGKWGGNNRRRCVSSCSGVFGSEL